VGAAATSINWGDSAIDNELGRTTGGTIFGNYNLAENWDFTASYAGAWDSLSSTNADFEAHTVLLGLNYLLASDFPVTPYVGGAMGVASTKIDSDSESDTAYTAGIGVEWDICKDAFLDVAVDYVYIDNNLSNYDGAYVVSAMLGVQVIESLMLVGGLSYAPEEYDSTAMIGLVLHQ
jgi:opacity protein-like surface antigen